MPSPGPGEALVRVVWLAFDPTQRGWLNDGPNYMDPVPLGAVMRGGGVGRVVASNSADYAVGDWVCGMVGWQDYAIATGQGLLGLNVVPPGVDPKAMLSIFGATGLTAYFGMIDIGKPAAGETVLVSGAAGATGSIAGQIAKALGCRVIGIAGGTTKCTWVTEVARFDACIDYKTDDVEARIRELAPDGINVFFDNVGGAVLDAALANIAERARIVVCGGISSGYEVGEPPPGPRNYLQLGLKRARMEGFIFLDYLDRFPEAFGRLHAWMTQGDIVYAEDIQEGLELAPAMLRGLFEGRNLGKQLLRVAPDPLPSS
ncbi:NADP-dependent oxidoreductase [Nocardia ninae]